MTTLTQRDYERCLEEAEINAEIARNDPNYVGEFYSFPFYYTIIDGQATISRVETDITFKGLTYPSWQLEQSVVSRAFIEKPVVLVDHKKEAPAPKPVPKPPRVFIESEEDRKARARALELSRTVSIFTASRHEQEVSAKPDEYYLDRPMVVKDSEAIPLDTDFLEFGKLDLKLLAEADEISFRDGSTAIPNVKVGPLTFIWEPYRSRSMFADGFYLCWVDENSNQTINGVNISGLGGFSIHGLKEYLTTGKLKDLSSYDPTIKDYRLHLYKSC